MATITNQKHFMMVWTSQGTKTLRLRPGLNEIENEDLKCLLKHPVFQDYIKRGWITVIEDITSTTEVKTYKKPGPKKVEEIEFNEFPEFENMSTREIIRAIDDITDKEKLEQIAKDHRPRIAEAAKQQLSIIV